MNCLTEFCSSSPFVFLSGPARAHVRAAARGEGVGAVEDIVVVTAAAAVPHEPLAALAVAHPLPTEGPSLLPLPSLTS